MHESRKDFCDCADLIGRAAMGKQFDKGKTTVTNWYNEDSPVPLDVWVFSANTLELHKNKNGKGISIEKLERILRISLDHLQERDFPVNPLLESAPILEEMPYFKRFALSKEDPAWEVERRGRPAKNAQKGEKKCADPHTFKGRIKDFIRKKYQLGGVEYCAQAEAIWERKRHDLMQAVDVGLLFMSDAETLLVIPATDAEWQEVLGSRDKKAIQAFMKARGLK